MTNSFLETVKKDFKASSFWEFIGLQMKVLQEGQVELYLPFNPSFNNVETPFTAVSMLGFRTRRWEWREDH